MIKIKGLEKNYRGFKVLKGLDMTINKGDVYGFIGKNGCGKTTAMNIICNIIPKDGGELIIGSGAQGEKIKIGYLPETPSLYGYMNGYEYLDYIASCCEYEGDINRRTAEVLDVVGMTEGASRRVKGYSRGMNQRLGIGAAIYSNPDLLILDEPTSALDPEGRMEVMTIIGRLMEMGTTILLCTHILSDVERVANKVGIITNGVMADEGEINTIINRHAAKNAVNIKLSDHTPENISLLKTSEFVSDTEINTSTGELTFYAENSIPAEKLINSLMKKMAEASISPLSLAVNRPNLEQVYMKIIGEERKR